MANAEHPAILKQGAAAWNKWRGENRDDAYQLAFDRLIRDLKAEPNP